MPICSTRTLTHLISVASPNEEEIGGIVNCDDETN